MRVYQSSNGQWIFWDGEKHYFDTESEAEMAKSIAEQKLEKAEQVQEWATELAGLDDFLSVVNARAFGQGGDNEPTDDDLAALGITQADYRNGMSMLLALEKFVEGTAEAGDIASRLDVIARLRTDV